MPCSWCGQWIQTGLKNNLSDFMEYEGIREADGSDRIFPGCHWWWIKFPCRPDDRAWGVVGFLRCEACQQPDDGPAPEDPERAASPRPLHHTEVPLRFMTDRLAGRFRRSTSPTDAEAPNCRIGGVHSGGRFTENNRAVEDVLQQHEAVGPVEVD